MTLTFMLAAGIVIQEEGREGAREMLIGILGCNLAWGIIDGVLYVLGQVFDRGWIKRIGFQVRLATSDDEARRMVADELDETLLPRLTHPRGATSTMPSSIVCAARPSHPTRCGARTCWAGSPRDGWCSPAASRRCCRSCSSTSRAWPCAYRT
jgi:hypothetical protein